MSDSIYVAKRAAMVFYEGRRIMVKKGMTTIREGHPILKANPDLFQPLNVDFETAGPVSVPRVVEEATDVPNQPRKRGRPPLPRDEFGNIIHPSSDPEFEVEDRDPESGTED